MTTSRVGAVIDALVAQFGAGTAVQVFDGPPVRASAPADFVAVGCDDDGESVVPLTQAWAGLGANARTETGQVPCAAVAQDGGTNIKALRDRVLVIVGELELALVADPTLGGVVSSGQLLVEDSALRQAQTPQGARASITFTVSYRARL